MRYDRIPLAVAALTGRTEAQWNALPEQAREALVEQHGGRALAVYFAGRGNADKREVRDGGGGRLPGVYPHPEYAVVVFINRRHHRWTVDLRCHDGASVVLAEYRWRWAAARFVRRSWRLAR